MSSIFPMTSVAIFFGNRARAASNSAEKICVALPGIALGARDARAPGSKVCLAATNRSFELRRHFQLVFEPLLQPFPQFLGILHGETRDCGFDFCDCAHTGHNSFPGIGLQGTRDRFFMTPGEISVVRSSPAKRALPLRLACNQPLPLLRLQTFMRAHSSEEWDDPDRWNSPCSGFCLRFELQ